MFSPRALVWSVSRTLVTRVSWTASSSVSLTLDLSENTYSATNTKQISAAPARCRADLQRVGRLFLSVSNSCETSFWKFFLVFVGFFCVDFWAFFVWVLFLKSNFNMIFVLTGYYTTSYQNLQVCWRTCGQEEVTLFRRTNSNLQLLNLLLALLDTGT